MKNQKSKPKYHHYRRVFIALMVVTALAGVLAGRYVAHPVKADEIQPLIDAVTKQIQDNQAVVNQKQAEGDTLQNRLDATQAELRAAEANLELTGLKIKQNKLDQEKAKQELDYQTKLLRDNIAAIYKQGGISPLEVLASSDNLSDFVGRQSSMSAIRTKIDQNMAAIKASQSKLDSLLSQLKQQAEEEKLQAADIEKKKTQIAELLAKTRGEEAAYQQLVEADKIKLAALRSEQAAVIAAQSAGRDYTSTTEYTWQAVEPFPSWGVDPWGFYYRQCTSYAAWRRAKIGRPIPSWGFMGPADAKEWANWGRRSNYRVDRQPEVGAIGVYASGQYGHVMIVEAIVANGNQVLVSEFNANWDGRYSQSLWPISVLEFVH